MADYNGFVETTIAEFMPMAKAMLDEVRSDIAGSFDMDDPSDVLLTDEDIRRAISIQAAILTPDGAELADVVVREPSLLFIDTNERFDTPSSAIRAYLVQAITERIVALMADRLMLAESGTFDLDTLVDACTKAIAVSRDKIGDEAEEAAGKLEKAISALPAEPDGMDVFRLLTPMLELRDQMHEAQFTDDWPAVGPRMRKLGEAVQIVNSDYERIASNGWTRPIASRP